MKVVETESKRSIRQQFETGIHILPGVMPTGKVSGEKRGSSFNGFGPYTSRSKRDKTVRSYALYDQNATRDFHLNSPFLVGSLSATQNRSQAEKVLGLHSHDGGWSDVLINNYGYDFPGTFANCRWDSPRWKHRIRAVD